MLQKLIGGLKLNKITPTKDYYDTSGFQDTSSIDIHIIYGRQDVLKSYKKTEPQRKTKNKRNKRNKRNKFTFLLKFINCLKR